MPDRRLALAPRLAAAGLPPPSAATLATLRDVVDEGVLGASNHVALALPLIARIAAEGDDPERAFRAAEETARFIAETRGAAAPIVANALDWLLEGVPDAPAGDRASLLAARAARWSHEAGARRAALVAHAVEALAGISAPLTFDYSSTVADIVVGPRRPREAAPDRHPREPRGGWWPAVRRGIHVLGRAAPCRP